jgi:hypothetical protein
VHFPVQAVLAERPYLAAEDEVARVREADDLHDALVEGVIVSSVGENACSERLLIRADKNEPARLAFRRNGQRQPVGRDRWRVQLASLNTARAKKQYAGQDC